MGVEVLAGDVKGQLRAMICANLATIRAEQGYFDEALELVESVASADCELPMWTKASVSTVRAVVAFVRQGRLEAEREIMTALEVTSGDGCEAEHGMLKGLLAEFALSAGDYAAR